MQKKGTNRVKKINFAKRFNVQAALELHNMHRKLQVLRAKLAAEKAAQKKGSKNGTSN